MKKVEDKLLKIDNYNGLAEGQKEKEENCTSRTEFQVQLKTVVLQGWLASLPTLVSELLSAPTRLNPIGPSDSDRVRRVRIPQIKFIAALFS